MESKMTPGPWQASGNMIVDTKGNHVAYADSQIRMVVMKDEELANAKAIAALPEISQALRILVNLISDDESRYDMYKEEIEQASAALAKAGL